VKALVDRRYTIHLRVGVIIFYPLLRPDRRKEFKREGKGLIKRRRSLRGGKGKTLEGALYIGGEKEETKIPVNKRGEGLSKRKKKL